jgi:histidinol-phosphate aminotransferase
MLDPTNLVRAHVLDMPPYEPILPFEVLSQKLGRRAETIIKLDANENPYGPVSAVKEALAALPYPHIYPDPESRNLRQALAEYHHVPAESILAGAGADELIDLIMRLFIEPGDAILNCPPTFGMYAFDADLNRARVISIPRTSSFNLNISGIEGAAKEERAKIIFLANPNNPDGGLTSREEIESILRLPLLVVLDEAYVQFSAQESSMIDQVTGRNNLIVLRTFSKWAALAGLRVGYGVFPEALMAHLWKIKQPYNVSVAASTAACAALMDVEQIEVVSQRIVTERERLYIELKKVPYLEPLRSQANFILCRVKGREASTLKVELARRGILVRYFNKPGLEQCIRISVGKPEHTEALMHALKEMEVSNAKR